MVKKNTSWESVKPWYHQIVGEKGHYYHQKVILPKTLNLLQLKSTSSVLDLACGQGILAKYLPDTLPFTGVDLSSSLIQEAKKKINRPHCHFFTADVTKPLQLPQKSFTHVTCLLALQNVRRPDLLIKNASLHLKEGGTFFIVINHPCFRIPRQSSWGIDLEKQIQYRRIDRYMTPMEIPIQAHPGQGKLSPSTLSFHFPLSKLCQLLFQQNFAITHLEELCSDKISTGKAAKRENISRKEFPLFLAVLAKKLPEE